MAIKVGINGYGRIGRNVLRALYESKRTGEISIVAINDLGDANTNAHLTRHDTAHGPFPGKVAVDGGHMVVDGDRIRVLAERDPARLPWGELDVDFVLECTGLFANKEKAGKHIAGGAKKVVVSAPADGVVVVRTETAQRGATGRFLLGLYSGLAAAPVPAGGRRTSSSLAVP